MKRACSVRTILVADDDLEVRVYFETILKIQGYGVLTAESGGEALRFLEQRDPLVSLVQWRAVNEKGKQPQDHPRRR